MTEFRAGDIVSCKDPAYFAQLGLRRNCGIVLESKKGSHKVMFDDFGGGYWLNREHLVPFAGSGGVSPVVAEVGRFAVLLAAEAIEVEKKGDRLKAAFFTDKLGLDQLEKLRGELGERLSRLQVLPHMMAELQVELEYRV